MDTLYTFRDNTTHYKTESVDFLGLMNSATRCKVQGSVRYYVLSGLGSVCLTVSGTQRRILGSSRDSFEVTIIGIYNL